MNLQLAPNAPLSDGQASWNAAAAAQLAIWNQHLVRSTFLWVNDSTAPVGSGNLADDVIFAADNFGRAFGDGTLAVTSSFRIGTRIIEADVSFNTKYKWDSYRAPCADRAASTPSFHASPSTNLVTSSVLSHPDQAGQFVSAVMNSTAGDIDTLADDDKAGAAFLYAANDGATAPSILIPLYNQSPVRGDAVEFAVSVSGTAPFSYQWRRNNVVQGVSTPSFVLSNVAAASAGTWTVTVTNSKGSASSSMLLTVTDSYVAPTITTQPASAIRPARAQRRVQRRRHRQHAPHLPVEKRRCQLRKLQRKRHAHHCGRASIPTPAATPSRQQQRRLDHQCRSHSDRQRRHYGPSLHLVADSPDDITRKHRRLLRHRHRHSLTFASMAT